MGTGELSGLGTGKLHDKFFVVAKFMGVRGTNWVSGPVSRRVDHGSTALEQSDGSTLSDVRAPGPVLCFEKHDL